jgi:hypothetical protein
LPTINSLPDQISSFETSSAAQIASQQTVVERLQTSNASLTSNNQTLMQQNADLTNSLSLSQQDLVISEQLRSQSATDLQNSMQSTTQAQEAIKVAKSDVAAAQADAKSLGVQLNLFKGASVVLGIGAADLAVKAFSGKDVIEWVITLFKK